MVLGLISPEISDDIKGIKEPHFEALFFVAKV